MSDRFQKLIFTRVVGAGVTSHFALALPSNSINIAKIRIAPSLSAIDTEFRIFKDPAYGAASVVYATDEYDGFLIDPVNDDGVAPSECEQGFVAAYEDNASSNQLYIEIKNNSAFSCTYSGEIWIDPVYSQTSAGIVVGVPDDLRVRGYASALVVTTEVTAKKNAGTVDLAEFRAAFVASGSDLPYYDLRTPAEGGTFAHNGTTKLIITGLPASPDGSQYIFSSGSDGRWYYAWRLHNGLGWSNWSDGNLTPSRVTQYVDTRDLSAPDAGPPSDWDIFIQDGPASNTIVARVTRPKVNGDLIKRMIVQVKDADVGVWTSLFGGPDVDNIKWDGRLVGLDLSSSRTQLTDPSSGGFGTAAKGDLVLLDVRGSVWAEAYCQWGIVRTIAGNIITIDGYFDPTTTSDLRAVIVKPPWAWSTGGYLGGTASNHGIWPSIDSEKKLYLGDLTTKEFVTTPIVVPGAVTNPEARAWFENAYSVSDDAQTHSTGKIGLPAGRLFTNFLDTRYFVPIYSMPDWATVTFDSNGACTVASVDPRTSNGEPGQIFGIRGHFAVYPDLDGRIMLRAKWENVTIPVYALADPTQEMTGLILCQMHPWAGSRPVLFAGLWVNYRNNADIRFGQGSGGSSIPQLKSFTFQPIGGGNGYIDVARPAAGYTLEMRLGFSTPVGVGSEYFYALTTCEYSLNGGAWHAVPNIALGKGIDYQNAVVEGVVPTIGMLECYHSDNNNLAGWTAKLTEFEVIYGIIRQFRLQV